MHAVLQLLLTKNILATLCWLHCHQRCFDGQGVEFPLAKHRTGGIIDKFVLNWTEERILSIKKS